MRPKDIPDHGENDYGDGEDSHDSPAGLKIDQQHLGLGRMDSGFRNRGCREGLESKAAEEGLIGCFDTLPKLRICRKVVCSWLGLPVLLWGLYYQFCMLEILVFGALAWLSSLGNSSTGLRDKQEGGGRYPQTSFDSWRTERDNAEAYWSLC